MPVICPAPLSHLYKMSQLIKPKMLLHTLKEPKCIAIDDNMWIKTKWSTARWIWPTPIHTASWMNEELVKKSLSWVSSLKRLRPVCQVGRCQQLFLFATAILLTRYWFQSDQGYTFSGLQSDFRSLVPLNKCHFRVSSFFTISWYLLI